jgi:D-methionine transport system substrate-binding protein
VTNGGRALRVLARNGLITLKPGHSELPTTEEILLNPRNLKFTEITQAMMIQVLDDVAAGFAYSVNAVDAGLNPLVDPILKDAIDFEKNQDQHNFIIIFSALVTQANNETYRKVVNAYHTPAVARAYKQYYLGAITPVIDSRTVDLSRY